MIKKQISGILLTGIFLLLISFIFLIMQIILAFKLHWSFDDFSSILIIVRWWVSIAAAGVFILGSIGLIRKKLQGWWISILYLSILFIGSVIIMYGYISVFQLIGLDIKEDELFPAFIGVLLGCLNFIFIFVNQRKFIRNDSKPLNLLFLIPLVISGIIILALSLLIGTNQLNGFMKANLGGGYGILSISFMVSKWLVFFGAFGISIWGGIGMMKGKPWKWRLGISALGIVIIGSIGIIFFGLNILERSVGAYISWGYVVSSLIGILSAGYLFQYLIRKKNHFSD